MNRTISCPKCSHRFALSEAVNRELELKLRKTITRELEAEQTRVLHQLKLDAAEQATGALADLQTLVDAQAKQLLEARKKELALLRAKAELQEEAQSALLDARRTLGHDREQIRNSAEQQFLEEHRLQDADKNKQLQDLRRQISELKQKAEQGSQQLQGAVQEIELRKILCERFPKDQIRANRTGARGADIVQQVITDSGQYCRTILWESKRTRRWSDRWIEKLLNDKESVKADLAVIVTNALPSNVVHMGALRGVLLTTFALAPCLAITLRVNMSLLAQTRTALFGQDDQKSRVFQYFLSPEFVNRLSSTAHQIEQMQTDLAKEKIATTQCWARRENRIASIAYSSAKFAGELRSLYGSELPSIPQFELLGRAEKN
jgi:hypothetical protein